MPYKTIKKEDCPHTAEMKITSSDTKECEVCGVKESLRFCTSCGGVFCCESLKAHNREHFQRTGHPIIKPLSKAHSHLGDWTWCWKCDAYLE